MSYKNIGPWEFNELKSKEDHVILDIRTPGELLEGSIASGCEKLNFYDPSFEKEIDKLDKSKAYVIYCRSGLRSRRACELMAIKGFGRLYNLEGGIVSYNN